MLRRIETAAPERPGSGACAAPVWRTMAQHRRAGRRHDRAIPVPFRERRPMSTAPHPRPSCFDARAAALVVVAWFAACEAPLTAPADSPSGSLQSSAALGGQSGVCDRTWQVRDEILERVRKDDCADITDADLAEHRSDAPEAHLPQAGDPEADRACAEGSVAGRPAQALPLTEIRCAKSGRGPWRPSPKQGMRFVHPIR